MMDSLFTVQIATRIKEAIKLTLASDEACCSKSVEDQQLHVQSINPDDSVAQMECLRIENNALRDIQSFMRKNIAQAAAAGEVATVEEEMAYNVANLVSLTVNGLKTLKNILLLIDKKEEGTLTESDNLYFERFVLFFTNNLLPANTARKVIEDAQQEVLNRHCGNLTPSQVHELFKLSEFSQGETRLQKNANNIKAINHIHDYHTFYESLVTLKGDLEGYPVGFSSVGPVLININNELHIAPNKLVQISSADRKQILDATKKVKDSAMSNKVYEKKIQEILSKNRVVMQRQRNEAITRLKEAFKTDNLDTIKIGGNEIFKDMIPYELDRLDSVMTSSCKNYGSKILEIVNDFAAMRNCKTLRDYCNYVEFVCKYLSKLKDQKDGDFREALKIAKMNEGFNEQKFEKQYGIVGNKKVHFSNQVCDYFFANREESFKDLHQKYLELESTVIPLNANIAPNFASDASAISHYFKHSVFGNIGLTEEQYFSIASELVKEPLNQLSAQLNQDGDKMMIKFTNPVNGAVGIVFEKLVDGTQSLATVYYDSKFLNKSN